MSSSTFFDPRRSSSRELPVGLQIGRYTIQRPLARGGMGAIYEIHDERGQRLALKTLLHAEPGGELLARFQREAAALAQLDHPNILRLVEVFPEAPALVLEYIDGETLKDCLIRHQQDGLPGIPQIEALDVAEQLSKALSECHAHGIIHRDLKPENILIESETGRVVLIDFGLAGAINTDLHGFSTSLTQSQQVLGTFGFMSPEQLDPSSWGELTTATDIYALAATLCVALSGQGPHGDGSTLELQAAILTRSAPSLRLRRPDLSPELDRLLTRCLERDPSLRPDADEFFEELLKLPAEGSRAGRSWIGLGVALLIFVVLSGLVAFKLTARIPPTILLEPYPKLTRETSLRISGQIKDLRADDRLLLDGRDLRIDSLGTFETQVELQLGPQSPELCLRDRDGALLSKLTIELVCDRSPPFLSLDGYDELTCKDSAEFKGRVNSIAQDPGTTVSLGGRELIVDKDGYFQATASLNFGDNELPLIATDQAGNRSSAMIRLARLHRIEVRAEDDLISILTKAPKPTWVFMKSGNYSINLQVAGRWVFEGEAAGAVLIRNDHQALIKQVSGQLELRNLSIERSASASREGSSLVSVEKGTAKLVQCQLKGAACGVQLKPQANLTAVQCQISDCDTGLELNGAELRMNRSAVSGTKTAIKLSGVSRIWMTESELSKSADFAIKAEKGSTILLFSSKLSEAGTLIAATISQLQMSDCELSEAKHVAIDLLGCKLSLNLKGVSLRGSGPIGLRLNDSHLEAADLKIQGYSTAIDLSEQSRITLKNPVLRDFNRDGLSARSSSRIEIEDGILQDGRLAILLAESARATITNTRFQDMGWTGVQVQTGGQAELRSCQLIRCEEGLEARAQSYIKAIGCLFEGLTENEKDDLEGQGCH